ncbi:MAG: carbohydrate-binding family 9-like protein [Cyclobacteriaceae bacterium]
MKTLPSLGLLSLMFMATRLCGQTYPPAQYIAYQTLTPILIDGRPDSAWQSAPWSDYFIDIEGVETPMYHTRVKMLWDSTYLYFYAELEEPHVWADIRQRDAVIFYNNDFEIFIDPDGDTHHYMEFEINALNTVWDLFLTKPYRNQPQVIDAWDIPGLKTAVQVRGTLNQPEDVDEGWSVEIAMPWAALTEAGSQRGLPVGEYWRINFSRVNWHTTVEGGRYARQQDAQGNYLPEFNWVWSPQGVVNMHEPERWGYVYFSEELSETKEATPLSADEPLQWQLYEIYRKLRREPADPTTSVVDTLRIGDKRLPVYREYHRSGWNLWVISPFTGQQLLLKEDGQRLMLPPP